VELQGFVSGELPRERARFVVHHFLRGCEQCRMALAPHLPIKLGWKAEPAALAPEVDRAYGVALDQAATAVRLQGAPPSSGASPKQEALALLTVGGMAALADAPSHLDGVTLIEALLERSWDLRYEDPAQMVELAEVASQLALKLRWELCSTQQVRNLQCRSWAELGNAYRVADDLDRATDALGRAAGLLMQGGVDDLVLARVFDVEASLYASRRLFHLAHTSLDIAYAIYCRLGEQHLAGRTLISKGVYTGYNSQPDEAIRLIQRGLDSIDQERDPGLVFLAFQNKARALMDCGHFRQAKRVLWDLRNRQLNIGGRVNDLKVRWLEGQIRAGLGELDWAERALVQVKQGFAEANLRYKAALAGTELGAVLLRQGLWDRAEKEALEAVEVFRALSVSAEVAKAIALLKNAFETKVATVALIEYVADFLRRAEHDPKARFLPHP
jgi:tetratricopeptide (TPR) repeat protein